MGVAGLINVHNRLSRHGVIKSWKQPKTKLVARIIVLLRQAAEEEAAAGGHVGACDDTGGTTDKPQDWERGAQAAEAAPSAPTGTSPGYEGPTIRQYALELLCQVDYYEDKTRGPSPDNRVSADFDPARRRSVGFSYAQVLASIRTKFPDCETSLACLRWYVAHVRQGSTGYESFRLAQRRPRVKSVKSAEAKGT